MAEVDALDIERRSAELLGNRLDFGWGYEQEDGSRVDEATDEAERSPMPDPNDAGRGLFFEDGYWNG